MAARRRRFGFRGGIDGSDLAERAMMAAQSAASSAQVRTPKDVPARAGVSLPDLSPTQKFLQNLGIIDYQGHNLEAANYQATQRALEDAQGRDIAKSRLAGLLQNAPRMEGGDNLVGGYFRKNHVQLDPLTEADAIKTAPYQDLARKAYPEEFDAAMKAKFIQEAPKIEEFGKDKRVGYFDKVTGKWQSLLDPVEEAPKDDFKVGQTRDYQVGDEKVTEEYVGKGQWREKAKGPMWAPRTGQPRIMYDENNAPVSYTPEMGDANELGLSPKPHRVVSNADQKSLQTAGANLDTYGRLNRTFKDSYVGSPITGSMKVAGAKMGFGDKAMGEWWSDYQTMVNAVRNDLFGAALTPAEKAEFDKQMITEGMDATLARQNLKRQVSILETAASRQASGLASQGYGKKAIETFLGRELSSLPDPMKPPNVEAVGDLPTPQTPADYAALPSGAIYIDPDDGKQYRKP